MFQLNLSQLQLLLRSETLDIEIGSSLDIASEKDALLEFWTGADAETAQCLSPPLCPTRTLELEFAELIVFDNSRNSSTLPVEFSCGYEFACLP
jgi:hypothetical protein